MDAVRRIGSFLQVQDSDGCRHLLRVTSVQALSDTDLMRNETFITAAGRTVRVPQTLDEIVELIASGEDWLRAMIGMSRVGPPATIRVPYF